MASGDEFSSVQNGIFLGAPYQRPSESVESSPPDSSSLSSTFETESKPSFSSTTDDNMSVLSAEAISQENGAMQSTFRPPFVPTGILTSRMPIPTVVNDDAMMSGRPFIPEPGYVQPPTMTNSSNLANGLEMIPPPLSIRYSRQELSFSGGRKVEPGSLHLNEAPKMFLGPPSSVLAPMKVFELPTENELARFPFPPVADSPRTWIQVYSDCTVNLAEFRVTLIINVLNAPEDLQIDARMLKVSVKSPSGKVIECHVGDSYSYVINSFNGNFKADEATGNYQVEVSMTIPPSELAKYKSLSEDVDADGTIRGSTVIVVSKNYFLDSRRDCLKIQCEHRISEVALPDSEISEASGPEQPPVPTAGKRGRLARFWGLTCDLRNNNLLYSDREANLVRCVNPEGKTVFEFGRNSVTAVEQQLNLPSGIEFDEIHNRLIVCDRDNHRVCFFTLDGKFISSFGRHSYDNGHFVCPWDVAVSPNGIIAVADSMNKRVQFFDANGSFLYKYSVLEESPYIHETELYHPRGVCFDTTGNLYVTDSNVSNVIRIPNNHSSGQKILATGAVYYPEGITMDETGNLLVADSRRGIIHHTTTKGEMVSYILEVVGQRLAYPHSPVSVTTMAGGFLAVLYGDGTINIF